MRRFAPALPVLLLACATAQPVRTQQTAPEQPTPAVSRWKQERPVVLRHATILPVSGPMIPDGAIAFADGRITAIGPNAEVATPEGAEELDYTGRFITPGIVDAHSHLGVYASPGLHATSDGNEMTGPVTAEVSAEHGFWPQDPGLRRAAAGGITSLLVLPSSANLIGGRGFPVKLHFGPTAGELRFPGAPDALKIACGENPKRVYGRDRKSPPGTRMGNVAGYRQAFAAAQDYRARQQHWREKHEKSPQEAGPPPARDLRMETLAAVLDGEILVQNHCYRADEMAQLLEVADEFGFRIRAFHHALEAYKIRSLIAEKDVAVATWADWWGFKLEAWDGIPQNAPLIAQAGGRAVIHSDSPLGIQRLNQEAAKAQAAARHAGIEISDDEALKWITLNAAWVMGVADQTGSLEVGKMADLAIWNRHPLSVYARVERTIADGLVTYDIRDGVRNVSDFEAGLAQTPVATLASAAGVAPDEKLVGLAPSGNSTCSAGAALCQHLPLEPEASCLVFHGVAAMQDGGAKRVDVQVKGGTIAAMGKVESAGCRVIPGAGRFLAPGFIDPLTSLGIAEIPLEDDANDIGPRGDAAKEPIHAALRASDSINPASELLPVARLGGVTAAGVVPGGGLVSGQSALLMTDGTLRKAPLALHVSLGLSGHRAVSSTRGEALERLRELLDDAREYGRRKVDYDQNRMRALSASRLDLEALQPALAGKLPVVISADRASDLRASIALAKEYGLKLVLAGAAEAWTIAPELAAAGVPVILQPTDNLPGSFDRVGNRLDAASILSAAGVKVLFSTMNEAQMVRTLPQEAGNAVAWGMGWEQALRAITSNVADAFGIEGGRIALGQPADLVLWSGDPLELDSRPVAMWIGGKQVPLTSRQDALLRKYR